MSRAFIESVNKLDHLICQKSTGTPTELARKMKVSTRCVHNYISFMKKKGAPITYNRKRKSYIYSESGMFYFGFLTN